MFYRLFFFVAATGFAVGAHALSATFVEDLEDNDHDFQEGATTSHQIGGGISNYSWPIVNVNGNRVLRSQIDLTALPGSVSLVYTSKFFHVSNAPGRDFKFTTEINVSELLLAKVDDPEVTDRAVTVGLGVLGSGAFSPTSFVGFKDLADGQHYYIAILTLRRSGDDVDPWASDTEGKLHLFEHGGDGQIDSEAVKTFKGIGNSFTFSIEGAYSGGSLALTAQIDGGEVEASGTDSTPLTGTYFGMRSAAFSRSAEEVTTTAAVDFDYDDISVTVDHQPDAMISKGNSDKFKGEGIVNTSGKGQQAKTNAEAGDTKTFTIHVVNNGTEADSFKVSGPGSSAGYVPTYFDGNTNVTSAVSGAGYTTPSVAPGAHRELKLRVKTPGSASGSKSFKVEARSIGDASARDAVKAKVTIQ